MLYPLPGASRQCRVPPSADVPSGNTLGCITRRCYKREELRGHWYSTRTEHATAQGLDFGLINDIQPVEQMGGEFSPCFGLDDLM